MNFSVFFSFYFSFGNQTMESRDLPSSVCVTGLDFETCVG